MNIANNIVVFRGVLLSSIYNYFTNGVHRFNK